MRPLVVPVLLALALLAPGLASGDHVYSHRFVFEGRLVGADGLPLPGREVAFFAEGDSFEEPCGGRPHEAVTDAWGDFSFCFHKHALKVSATMGVSVGNVTIRKPMDTAFRRTVVLLQETNETGVAPDGWNATHRIAGKAWQPGSTTLEGVPVYGTAVAHAPVNVTLLLDGATFAHEVRTDAFGDFDATLVLPEGADARAAVVRVESHGEAREFGLSPTFHRVTAGIRVPPPADFRSDEGASAADPPPDVDVDAANAASRAPTPPGTGTPRVSPGLVVAIVAAGAAALWLRSRSQEKG